MPWLLVGSEMTTRNAAGEPFLVLPSRHRPRWLLPMGGVRLASSALELYAPATLRGKIYKLALLAFAISGLGLLLKSRTMFVCESSDSVLAEIRKRLTGGQNCSSSISCGTPGPDAKLTVQLILMSPAGGILAFAKVADSERARSMLANEARMLEFLSGTSFAGEVPKLIAQFEHEGYSVLLQTPLAGGASGNRFASEHWDFLSRLVLDRSITIGEYLLDQQRLAQRLVALNRSVGTEIVESLSAALSWLERASSHACRAVVIHGDFAPWNIRINHSSGKTRIHAFDWEYGREIGIPAWDALHFIIQTDILVHSRQPETILREVKNLFAGPRAESYLSACGLTPTDTKILLLTYLCEAIIIGLQAQSTITQLQNARYELLKLVLQNDF
jgi:hypothetical protein